MVINRIFAAAALAVMLAAGAAQAEDVAAEAARATVYTTPSGARWHVKASCAGKTASEATADAARARGLTACKKCGKRFFVVVFYGPDGAELAATYITDALPDEAAELPADAAWAVWIDADGAEAARVEK